MKVAVVTGGNRGIGKEVCRQLAQDGMLVILTARQIEKAELAASDMNEQVVPYQLDVTSEESVERLSAFMKDSYGRVDVLINNAGVFLDNIMDDAFPSFLDLPVSTLQETMNVNVYGAARMTKAVFPYMKEAGYGRIVNVSSGMGRLSAISASNDVRRDGKSGPYYRMSKAALHVLTKVTALEGAPFSILANAVCPGWVQTDMGTSEAVKTVQEGASGIVWAAQLPRDGPTGELLRDGKRLQW
ncbi:MULTISPECIES: SDR family NAD(P)-dependent oxidoreductase [Bacillus]|uniref:SDR family NAD(P)-dependent oxidoreductase n=1 Tax=Bacillus sp. BS1807G30 TaxID=3153756 RepID=A0AAU7FP71_9BACI|nr:SDR family NAD(P)-dependent oxidoreductase [Bacillus altitudinis]MCY7671844.1 SDR family NAD(P)-dependent oxidoreductase [Bacillus altitudinis]UJM29251.1 SDR family NAD(P)-dependent oxidoreductase [Bacillus aerophilus]